MADGVITRRRGARPPAEIEQILPFYETGGESFFGYRMVLTARLFDQRVSQILRENGKMTLAQWRVLAQLGHIKSGTVRSLAEGGATDRAEVSRVLGELVNTGLVKRRDNEADFRSPLFSLTEKGRKFIAKLRRPISDFVKILVDDISEKDLEAADRVLWAVARGSMIQQSVPGQKVKKKA